MLLLLTHPFLSALLVAAMAACIIDRWMQRARVLKSGPSFAVDLTGAILLLASAVGLWTLLPEHATLGMVLIASAGVYLVSALTDLGRPLRGLRFAAAALAGTYLCTQDLCITSVKLPFSVQFINLGWTGVVITILWLGLSGALFARAQTLPRVALGVGAMASATLYAVGVLQPQVTGAAAPDLALVLTGSCLGMLPFTNYLNRGYATAGGYVLGFMVGLVAVMGALKNTAFLVALLPLMVIGVPAFAAVCSWVRDLLYGRRLAVTKKRHPHLHELLMCQGYSESQVTLILLAGTAALCGLGLLLVWLIEVSFAVKALLLVLGVSGALLVLYVVLRLMRPAHPPSELPTEIEVLGVRVHRVTMAEAMERVESFIRSDQPHMIVTSDAIGIMKTREDEALHQIVNTADLVTADGAGVILAARLLGLPLDVRVSGCDMVTEISRVVARLKRSVYLLGAAPGVAVKAAENLTKAAPGLTIAGCRDGYFTPEEEPAIIAEITHLKPAALFVALGIPRQEYWIKNHMAELGVPVCIGIGGSFDVISGLKQRAPVWMQRTGLEWLYRVAKEPSRLPRLWALPRLMCLTFAQLLRPPDPEPIPPEDRT